VPALQPACLEHCAAAARGHAGTEPVRPRTLSLVWLVGALHLVRSFRRGTGCRGERRRQPGRGALILPCPRNRPQRAARRVEVGRWAPRRPAKARSRCPIARRADATLAAEVAPTSSEGSWGGSGAPDHRGGWPSRWRRRAAIGPVGTRRAGRRPWIPRRVGRSWGRFVTVCRTRRRGVGSGPPRHRDVGRDCGQRLLITGATPCGGLRGRR
jgi:hypothetical protein